MSLKASPDTPEGSTPSSRKRFATAGICSAWRTSLASFSSTGFGVPPVVNIPGWHGIFTTGGTPKPVLEKLANDVRQALQIPAVANRFRELGVEPSGVSGDAFNDIVRRDYARWGEIIRKNNLRAD